MEKIKWRGVGEVSQTQLENNSVNRIPEGSQKKGSMVDFVLNFLKGLLGQDDSLPVPAACRTKTEGLLKKPKMRAANLNCDNTGAFSPKLYSEGSQENCNMHCCPDTKL